MIMEKQESGPYQKVLIKPIENSCSWEASSGSARHENTCPLYNMKVRYHICRSQSLNASWSTWL
jgi:hypothetical protein